MFGAYQLRDGRLPYGQTGELTITRDGGGVIFRPHGELGHLRFWIARPHVFISHALCGECNGTCTTGVCDESCGIWESCPACRGTGLA